MSLYKKYRPASFDEFIGNEIMIKELKKLLKNTSNNPAILLTGETGTGKTTLARIIAAKWYGDDNTSKLEDTVPFLEISVADFRGIDTAREIRNTLRLNPLWPGPRVFFMDECAGLTSDAQRAFLKVIEETPDDTYFLFATTEIEKLREDLINRLSHFHIDTLTEDDMVLLLGNIANKEGEEIETDIFRSIARISKCRPRKAILQLESIIPLDPEEQKEALIRKITQHATLDLQGKSCTSANYSSNAYPSNKHEFSPTLTTEFFLTAIESLTCTSTELLQKKFPKKKSFMKPFVNEGDLIMIHANAGAGKTMFTLTIALALTRHNGKGINIGKFNVEEQCGVMILDGEMRPQEIQERITALTGPMGDESPKYPLKIVTSDEMSTNFNVRMNLTNEKCREALYVHLQRTPVIKLLILDNIASLAPGLNENSKRSWDTVNQWLLSMRSLGVAVIIVHHSNKSGGYRGHSARTDNLDTVIVLKSLTEADNLCFEVKYKKTRGAKKGTAQNFSIQAVEHKDNPNWLIWERVDSENSEKVDDGKNDLVMAQAMLQKIGQREIAEMFNVSQGTVSNCKREAVKKGFLTRKGELTEEGSKFLDNLNHSSNLEESESSG